MATTSASLPVFMSVRVCVCVCFCPSCLSESVGVCHGVTYLSSSLFLPSPSLSPPSSFPLPSIFPPSCLLTAFPCIYSPHASPRCSLDDRVKFAEENMHNIDETVRDPLKFLNVSPFRCPIQPPSPPASASILLSATLQQLGLRFLTPSLHSTPAPHLTPFPHSPATIPSPHCSHAITAAHTPLPLSSDGREHVVARR